MFTFDTQQVYRDFSGPGSFTETQAESLTQVLREIASLSTQSAATKNELLILQKEIKSDLQLLEQRLTIRLGGIMAVGLGVLLAIQQLLG